MAKRDGRYIAGALNFFGEGMLFGRNWGCTEFVPFLHFETCYYQAIEFAIARGLKKVEAGAQGEHKLLRGYMPATTYSAHYIAHPGLRRAVDDYLAREREAVAEHIEELAEHGPFRKSPNLPRGESMARAQRTASGGRISTSPPTRRKLAPLICVDLPTRGGEMEG